MGRKGYGPPQYGEAMEIYSKIQDSCQECIYRSFSKTCISYFSGTCGTRCSDKSCRRYQCARDRNPVKRYHHYKKAYLEGELDPTFKNLSTWDLRMVVNGDEPDETLAWGREMLQLPARSYLQ